MRIHNLKETIRKLVKTEMTNQLKEQNSPMEPTPVRSDYVNPLLTRVKDQEKFVEWLMTFFDEEKHGDKSWWPIKPMTPDRVLSFVSDMESEFPLSPKDLVDLWSIKKSLKTDLSKVKDADLAAAEKFSKGVEKDVSSYQTGGVSLKNIGKDVGDLTAAMVQKLEKSGMEKVHKLLNTEKFMDMSEDEQAEFFEKAFEKVDQAREQTAREFASSLKAANGNVKNFIASLVKKQTLTSTDLKIMTPEEIEILVELSSEPEEFIVQYLLIDASRDNNYIKSFQAAVAHTIFPGGKRGRPRKNPLT